MSVDTKVTVGAELQLGGGSVSIVSVRAREGLSQNTHVTAIIASRTAIEVGELAGGTATLTLLANGVPARTFSLIVGQAAFAAVQQGSLRYRIELYSPFWLLLHTLGTRKFRDMSAKDIVTQVLSEAGCAFDWKIQRDPPVRKYCVQYRESHHDFVCRLLEFEGIYFVSRPDGSLSLEDTSRAADPIEGQQRFNLLEHAGGLEGGELGVHAFGWGSRVGTGKVTLNDYNWKTPDVKLLSSAAADADTEYELYDYPAGYRKPSQGAELSQMRLEAARARTRFARGGGNVVLFAPGHKLTFDGEELLLTDVEHRYEDPAFDDNSDEVRTYENHFDAIPADVPFRAPVTTPTPSIDGCHTVMVRGPVGEEIHTDRYGRFKAQFHWDREATGTDVDSRWLRKLQEGATSINLARVGWEVSTAYIDGDPDRPVGLTRNINGAMVPAYAQPIDKPVMTIKTPTYPGKIGFNELKLDDRSGDQRFDVRAELDFINRVNNDKTETIGQNQTHMVDLQLKHRVERDQALQVGGDQTITTGTNFDMKVHQNRTETIGGNQKLDIGGSLNVDVGNNQSERVGSLRLSIVGSISPPDVAANARAMVPDAGSTASAVGGAAVQGARGGGGPSIFWRRIWMKIMVRLPTPPGLDYRYRLEYQQR